MCLIGGVLVAEPGRAWVQMRQVWLAEVRVVAPEVAGLGLAFHHMWLLLLDAALDVAFQVFLMVSEE